MNWEPTADGHRCTRHGIEFPRGEVCNSCTTDPGDDASTTTSDVIDKEIAARAAEYTTRARRLWRECDEMLDGTPMDKIQAVKLSSDSVKWERLALEALDKLSARKHLREAMAHEVAMSGLRGPN